jgi:hypothetical protein
MKDRQFCETREVVHCERWPHVDQCWYSQAKCHQTGCRRCHWYPERSLSETRHNKALQTDERRVPASDCHKWALAPLAAERQNR